MEHQRSTGARRIINATVYSYHGLCSAFRHEAAFRQELLAGAILIPLAIFLGETTLARAVLIGSVMLVLITELLNTSVEAAIDRIGPDYHVLSKRAKDIGSAAVFISILNMIILWLVILI